MEMLSKERMLDEYSDEGKIQTEGDLSQGLCK